MSKGDGSLLDWGDLVPLIVHKTKLIIIEAMLWVDEPLAAVDIQAMHGGKKKPNLSSLSYHIKSLDTDLSILRLYDEEQVRGAWKKNYYFRSRTPASRRRKGAK